MKKLLLLLLVILKSLTILIAQNVNYTSLHSNDTFNRSINKSLTVGSLPGEGSVSNIGSSVYSIPLTLPPGTNGIAPNISIDYNSMSGSGIAGMGWNLTGLSFISRTPRSIYYDSEASPIDLGVNDKFSYDGSRLFVVSGSYGSPESKYTTEMEAFSAITAKGVAGDGPQSFEVLTKEGIFMQFGNTSNSRISKSSQGTVLIWALTKIQYPDGNYITFTYVNDAQALRITEIDYTGNAVTGLTPYNKINFEYKSRIDQNVTHEADLAVADIYLLDKIVVSSEGQNTTSYQFNYATDDINSFLKEVVQSGSDGSALNSTIFKYGDLPASFTAGSSNVTQSVSGDEFVGDFNGDGVSDILSTETVLVNNILYHKSFMVNVRTDPKQDNGYYVGGLYTLPSNSLIIEKKSIFQTSNFVASDFNGDGADDVLSVVTSFSGSQRRLDNVIVYKSVQNADWATNGNPPISFAPEEYPTSQNRIHASGNFLFTGDFNGDGVQDILTMLGENVSGVYKTQLILGGGDKESKNITTTGPAFFLADAWVTSDQIQILDFDGDSKSDIMLIKDNNTEIFSLEVGYAVLAHRIYYSSASFSKNDLIYLGDFNGDHKTDFLVRSSLTNNNIPWRRILSTGTDLFGDEVTFTKTPKITGGQTDDKLAIGDFNGDGRTDIYHGWQITSGVFNLDIYYSQGINFKFIHNSFSGNAGFVPAIVADLNGDGRTDIINRKCYCEPFDIFYFKKDGKENLLEKVSNGFNYVTEWAYKKLAEGGLHYKRSSLTYYPVNTIQPALYTVSDLNLSNGIGGTLTNQYNYEDAKLHKSGKGFLGFSKIISKNLTTGITTVSENEWDNTYFAIKPKKVSTFLASTNTLLSEVTKNIEFVPLGATGSKRFLYRLIGSNENNVFEGRTVSSTNDSFDNFGNVTQSTINNNGVETTVTNTSYGAFVTSIDNAPTSITVTKTRSGQQAFTVNSTLEYYPTGKLKTKIDFNGLSKKIVTGYEYDNVGYLKKTTITGYEGSSTMPPHITSEIYDSKGRYPETITNELNQTISATYDGRWGKQLTFRSVDGLLTKNQYDAFGRLKQTTVKGSPDYDIIHIYDWGNGDQPLWYNQIARPGKPDIKKWYDLLGRVVKTESEAYPSGQIIETQSYDIRGNVSSITQPHKEGESFITTNTLFDSYNRPYNINSGALGSTTLAYAYSSGNLTITTDSPRGRSSKTTDASGLVIRCTDNGGTLDYTYYSHGGVREVKNGSITLTNHEYDEYGRQTKLIDANAGVTQYVYNALGQLESQADANGNVHTMFYDLLGRNITRIGPEGTTGQEYYPFGSGPSTNLIKKITGFSGNLKEFTYDDYGRTDNVTETVDGTPYTTTYTYNNYGDVITTSYPSGFGTVQAYDDNGYLKTIKNNSGETLYTTIDASGLGNVTSYSLGNGKTSSVIYTNGYATQYLTDGVQNLNFVWDYTTGNLLSRNDALKNKTEGFVYDNLNRLKTTTIDNTSLTINYANNGNIDLKQDVGTFNYHPTKFNAVTGATSVSPNSIPTLQQDINYTAFMQPSILTERASDAITYELTYTYGADYERIKGVTINKQNNAVLNTRYYFGGYEKDITGNAVKYIQYVNSPVGLIAIVDSEGNAHTPHYVYTDYLGSILSLTTKDGAVEAQQAFDAWGRRRNPATWALLPPTTETALPDWLYRGFTAHEHLDHFGLINMNGRLYDPVLGRVLSPDDYVQNIYGTQDYNRYSYAHNNPLAYTDPDGNFPVVTMAIGAIIGGIVNGVMYDMQGKNFFQGFWRGAITGAVAGLSGYYAPIGAGTGALYGAGTGAISGGLGAALNGTNVWKGMTFGAALGGLSGGITGGIEAKRLGADFWSGARPESTYPLSEALAASGKPAPYTNDYLYKLKNEAWKNIGPGGGMSMDGTPKGPATLIDGVLIDSKGKPAIALTQPSKWEHGMSSKIYFSKAAFSSKEQLSVAMAHELAHVVYFNDASLLAMSQQKIAGGENTLLDDEGHLAIQKMTQKLIQLNGWNTNLFNNQEWKFNFQQPLPQLESAINFFIKRIKLP